MKISKINLRIIQDSRRENTLEAEIFSGSIKAFASVPSGKSKGKKEVISINSSIASKKLKEIEKEIYSRDFVSLIEFDNFLKKLDGTENKSNLGGNLILVLSIAFTKLFAKSQKLETYELIEKLHGKKAKKFPHLYFNLIGGGMHAKNSLPFQEYMLVTKFNSPAQGLKYAKKIVKKIKKDIWNRFNEERYGDEGAFAITNDDYSLGLEILHKNLDKKNVSLALDVAASSFYKENKYKVGKSFLSTDQILDVYKNLIKKFPIMSIEDPFSEEDEEGFSKINKKLKNKIWIIVDDLTATNPLHIQKAYEKKHATGVIIKPNQIGTVSETLFSIKLAQSFGWKIIISHRSGETQDDFIADLSFGVGADGLKSGSPLRKERLVKYNRLIEIEKKFNK